MTDKEAPNVHRGDEKELIAATQELTNLSPGQKALFLYGKFVERRHLFDKAFFGHRATRQEKRAMASLWKRAQTLAQYEAPKDEDGQPPTNLHGGLPGTIAGEAVVGGVDPGSKEEG